MLIRLQQNLTYIQAGMAVTPLRSRRSRTKPGTTRMLEWYIWYHKVIIYTSVKHIIEYQPSGTRVTYSPPATPQCLQNPNLPLGGRKMADRVWKSVHPLVFGHSHQLLQNKFFDPSTPSMRKVDNGGKQAGAELCQARLPTGILLNCD